MAIVSTWVWVITLNVNGLNCLIQMNGVADWIKIKIQLYTAYKTLTLASRTHTGWKLRDGKIFHANRNEKGARVAIFTSDKIGFRS